MLLKDAKIGLAITGSFCTYDTVFQEMENLVASGANVLTIFSNSSQTINSRFGDAAYFLEKAKTISGKEPICSIETAEPIGPGALLDVLIIAPCTGNTIAKLANAITDTPVLMAAKAHLRNDRPLVLALSSNDSLGLNLKNIGILMNSKNIFFVPFGQDNPVKKPNSMVSHMNLIIPALEAALDGKQLQPVINGY